MPPSSFGVADAGGNVFGDNYGGFFGEQYIFTLANTIRVELC
jgi:hypothetical protein